MLKAYGIDPNKLIYISFYGAYDKIIGRREKNAIEYHIGREKI